MRKQVEKRGFNMLAAGAFIGQMSYSDKVGTGRPDESDLAYHRSFGRKIAEKLKSGESLSIQKKLHTDYPKNTAFHWWKTVFLSAFPVGKVKVTRPLNRKAFTDACINCGKCEMQCPVGAIRLSEKYFDQKRCIGCVACVNNCPVKAIEITHKGMIKAAKDCESFFAERREPEFFL
jgi:ferredoxin